MAETKKSRGTDRTSFRLGERTLAQLADLADWLHATDRTDALRRAVEAEHARQRKARERAEK